MNKLVKSSFSACASVLFFGLWQAGLARAEVGPNDGNAAVKQFSSQDGDPEDSPPKATASFLKAYCFDCHNASAQEGGLDLTTLDFQLGNATTFAKWQKVFERVKVGEMPPKSEARAGQQEQDGFLRSLQQSLTAVDVADIAANGRVRGRRLTRTEYEHTLHDLLGIDIPLRNLLPEDSTAQGFETVADGQQLSHHLLSVYLDVADLALSNAFERAFDGDRSFKRFYSPEVLATKRRGNYRGPDLRDGKSISWPIGLQFFGRMYSTRVPEEGWYRIKLHGVHAVNPNENGSVWGTLRSGWCEANAPLLFMIGLVEATDTPRDLVYKAWIQEEHCLELKPNDGQLAKAPTGAKGGNVSFAGRNLAKDGFAGIAHHGIEIERIYPNADHQTVYRKLFGSYPPDALSEGEDAKVLEELVVRFASNAFRRPITDDVVQPYLAIGRSVMEEEHSLIEALRASYRAILCSPRFLTFLEPPGELDDFAIASRLSYALWTSAPDEQLLQLAQQSTLRNPKVLSAQIERMISDAKSIRFIKSFTDQWLKLNQIDFTTPDMQQFKTFDPVLQESMLQETRAYVTELFQKDLSVGNLIDSDFAFFNERLGRHYKFLSDSASAKYSSSARSPGQLMSRPVAGEGLQKVQFAPGDNVRGGLLSQGAILKVTADGSKTSPIVRGVFVNERILGERIPPPPPGVPAVEPDIRGATSIRDQLAKHRSDESCASCHKIIDPPGFALECFDATGGWRDRYGNRDSGIAIDTSGATPNGDDFADFLEWKKIYSERREQLARCFVEHFMTYATGAPVRFSDQEAIDTIVTESSVSDFGFRTLIHGTLTSSVFLKK